MSELYLASEVQKAWPGDEGQRISRSKDCMDKIKTLRTIMSAEAALRLIKNVHQRRLVRSPVASGPARGITVKDIEVAITKAKDSTQAAPASQAASSARDRRSRKVGDKHSRGSLGETSSQQRPKRHATANDSSSLTDLDTANESGTIQVRHVSRPATPAPPPSSSTREHARNASRGRTATSALQERHQSRHRLPTREESERAERGRSVGARPTLQAASDSRIYEFDPAENTSPPVRYQTSSVADHPKKLPTRRSARSRSNAPRHDESSRQGSSSGLQTGAGPSRPSAIIKLKLPSQTGQQAQVISPVPAPMPRGRAQMSAKTSAGIPRGTPTLAKILPAPAKATPPPLRPKPTGLHAPRAGLRLQNDHQRSTSGRNLVEDGGSSSSEEDNDATHDNESDGDQDAPHDIDSEGDQCVPHHSEPERATVTDHVRRDDPAPRDMLANGESQIIIPQRLEVEINDALHDPKPGEADQVITTQGFDGDIDAFSDTEPEDGASVFVPRSFDRDTILYLLDLFDMSTDTCLVHVSIDDEGDLVYPPHALNLMPASVVVPIHERRTDKWWLCWVYRSNLVCTVRCYASGEKRTLLEPLLGPLLKAWTSRSPHKEKIEWVDLELSQVPDIHHGRASAVILGAALMMNFGTATQIELDQTIWEEFLAAASSVRPRTVRYNAPELPDPNDDHPREPSRNPLSSTYAYKLNARASKQLKLKKIKLRKVEMVSRFIQRIASDTDSFQELEESLKQAQSASQSRDPGINGPPDLYLAVEKALFRELQETIRKQEALVEALKSFDSLVSRVRQERDQARDNAKTAQEILEAAVQHWQEEVTESLETTP